MTRFSQSGVLPLLEQVFHIGQIHTKLQFSYLDAEVEETTFMSTEMDMMRRATQLQDVLDGLIDNANVRLGCTNRRLEVDNTQLLIPLGFPLPPSYHTLTPDPCGSVHVAVLLRMINLAYELGTYTVRKYRLYKSHAIEVERPTNSETMSVFNQLLLEMTMDETSKNILLTQLIGQCGFQDRECRIVLGEINFPRRDE
jgi:hypothetical protein